DRPPPERPDPGLEPVPGAAVGRVLRAGPVRQVGEACADQSVGPDRLVLEGQPPPGPRELVPGAHASVTACASPADIEASTCANSGEIAARASVARWRAATRRAARRSPDRTSVPGCAPSCASWAVT